MKRFVGIAILVLAFADRAQAACGNVEVAKGDVKIESGQTKQATVATVGSKICSGDTIIAGKDSRAKLKMEDGNELNISPDSKIMLEQYAYNPAENKKKVLLNVLSGKVRAATKQENMYNDKARDGASNSFQVKTKSAVAGVRGTDFMTGYDPKTNKSEVVTFKGKVEFGTLGAGGQITGSVSVGAGQKTEMVAGQAPAPPKVVPPAELQKMNVETKSEAPAVSAAAPAAGGKSGDSAKKEDSPSAAPAAEAKGDGKSADSGKNGDGKRAPAAAGPVSGGSMIGGAEMGGDLGGSTAQPVKPATPQLPVIAPVVAAPVNVTMPTAVQNAIQTGGNAKVNVIIRTPGSR